MALAIALVALALIVCAFATFSLFAFFAWPLVGLAAFPVAAGVLLVLRHRYAEGLLYVVAATLAATGPVLLLTVIYAATFRSLPDWAVPAVVGGFVVSLASIVALSAGRRHLRGRAAAPA